MIKSLVLKGPGHLDMETRPAPIPGPTDVLIRVAFAAICHTDFICLEGQHPWMQYPTVLGHEFSGVVEECGFEVKHVKPGDRVTALGFAYCCTCSACRRNLHSGCRNIKAIPFHMEGAFQQMVSVPQIMVYAVDDSLSLEKAAMVEATANGVAAAERAEIHAGENVVVIGPGPIGLLAMQAAAFRQPRSLIMLGTRADRLRMAASLGATHTINVRQIDPFEAVLNITNGMGADAILFCGGGVDAWEPACRMLASNGRIAVEALADNPDAKWPVPAFDFTAKNASYLGVNGYNGSQFEVALELITTGKIDVTSLITHRFPLPDYETAFDAALRRKDGAIKVMFDLSTDIDPGQKELAYVQSSDNRE